MLSFLGTQLFDRSSHVETKVYVKPTNTGLLLLDHAFRLSSISPKNAIVLHYFFSV